MFTGIIESVATVLGKNEHGLTIERPSFFNDIKLGSSISVSGVCLSIIEFDQNSMRFDVVHETWKRTTLKGINKGDQVNVERALAADGRFEGHIVQGHIEDVGKISAIETVDEWTEVSIEVPDHLHQYCVTKGSIALDGISLTIARFTTPIVTVALIPHTLENTTLGGAKVGDFLNIETDILGRYVYNQHRED